MIYLPIIILRRLGASNITIDSYMDLLITFGSSFLEDLYGEGARRMILLSLPTLGVLALHKNRVRGFT
ncbi:hypothetical protein Ancab_026630 [Ancistrocladus abbreviatus]